MYYLDIERAKQRGRDRYDSKKRPRRKLNCGPGSKQCGNACIGINEKCHFGASKTADPDMKKVVQDPKVQAVLRAVATGKTSVTDIADALGLPNPKASQIIDFVLNKFGVPNIGGLASGAVGVIKRMLGMRTDARFDSDPAYSKAFLRIYLSKK